MIFIRIFFLMFLLLGLSTSLNAQEKVFPKYGDGITTLLKRHKRSGIEYQKKFIEINKDRLGKNNSLLMGVSYTLPPLSDSTPDSPEDKSVVKPKKTEGYESLFGSNYGKYEIISSELEGATFYVVSGHGGPDPGATARFENHTLHEDEYAYDIALRLARNLLMRGAKVHIIIQDAVDGIRDGRLLANNNRETCMGASIPRGHLDRLKQRTDKINDLEAKKDREYTRAVFIHIDSRSKDKKLDVFFYYSTSEASKQLANTLRNTFSQKYAKYQPNRGFTGTISGRNLYVLENTTPVAVYAELGNIQNVSDLRRIIEKDNREALAKWMCEGFVTDFNRFKAAQ